jgi:hypothetical protein
MTTSVNAEKLDTKMEVKEASVTPLAKRSMKSSKQPPADWPEFGEYARLKYPDELDEGIIVLIARLIEERGTLSG